MSTAEPNEVLLHLDAQKAYQRLVPEAAKALSRHVARLRADVTHGQQLAARKIPRTLRKRYGLRTLYRLALPSAHRALYTVAVRPQRKPRVVILWIGTHKQYDRLLGYKTS